MNDRNDGSNALIMHVQSKAPSRAGLRVCQLEAGSRE